VSLCHDYSLHLAGNLCSFHFFVHRLITGSNDLELRCLLESRLRERIQERTGVEGDVSGSHLTLYFPNLDDLLSL
jgi:hypothetical protein